MKTFQGLDQVGEMISLCLWDCMYPHLFLLVPFSRSINLPPDKVHTTSKKEVPRKLSFFGQSFMSVLPQIAHVM